MGAPNLHLLCARIARRYLFARRFMRLNNDPVRTLKQWFSMFCIGGVISYAFS
jgi:hypothetical protein